MNKLALIYDFMNVQYPPSHSPTHLPEGSLGFWVVDAATPEAPGVWPLTMKEEVTLSHATLACGITGSALNSKDPRIIFLGYEGGQIFGNCRASSIFREMHQ